MPQTNRLFVPSQSVVSRRERERKRRYRVCLLRFSGCYTLKKKNESMWFLTGRTNRRTAARSKPRRRRTRVTMETCSGDSTSRTEHETSRCDHEPPSAVRPLSVAPSGTLKVQAVHLKGFPDATPPEAHWALNRQKLGREG